MKQSQALLLSLISLLVLACTNTAEKNVQSADKIEGVRSENISDIIRMPISGTGEIDSSAAAKMSFEERLFNFDTLYEGDVAEHRFSFINEGKTSLIINNVRASCGCTTPSWPKEPIAPGEGGEIVVQFNSAGKKGVQNKDITIYANTFPNTTVLKVYGVVISPNNDKN